MLTGDSEATVNTFPNVSVDFPPSLGRVISSWRVSKAHHRWNVAADADSFRRVETTLQRRLPRELVALYELSDGIQVLDGNLVFNPLGPGGDGGITSVQRGSEELRKAGWQIPPEVVVFGSNGAGELFGVWLPAGGSERPSTAPVVEIGAVFGDQRCLALVGTSIGRFLTAWTAFYSVVVEADGACLDALQAPTRLQNREPDDRLLRSIFKWADADLPRLMPDPYEHGMTADDVRMWLASRGTNTP